MYACDSGSIVSYAYKLTLYACKLTLYAHMHYTCILAYANIPKPKLEPKPHMHTFSVHALLYMHT